METPDEQIIASKGDFDQPGQITPWIVSFPFADKGDIESKEYRASFVQRANEVIALPQGSAHPVDSTAVIIEQTPAEAFEGAMVKFDRVYSNAHLSTIAGKNGTGIVEYESRLYDVFTTYELKGTITFNRVLLAIPNIISEVDGSGEGSITIEKAFVNTFNVDIGDYLFTHGPDTEPFGGIITSIRVPLFEDFGLGASGAKFNVKAPQVLPFKNIDSSNFYKGKLFTYLYIGGQQKPIMHKVTKRYTVDDPFTINLQKKFALKSPPKTLLDNAQRSNVANGATEPDAKTLKNMATTNQFLRAEDDVVTEWRGNMREIKTVEVRASDAIGS